MNLGSSQLTMDTLNKRINQQEQVLAELAPESQDRAMTLNNLGSLLVRRFKKTDDLKDLDRAIDCTNQAVQLTPEGNAKFPLRAKNLCVNLMMRFNAPSPHKGFLIASSKAQDLEDAFLAAQQAIDSATEAEEKAEMKRRQDKMVVILEQSIEQKPRGHPDQLEYMKSLAIAFGKNFESKGNLQDFNRAVSIAEDALERNEDSHKILLEKFRAQISTGEVETSWEDDLIMRYEARKSGYQHIIGRLCGYQFERTGEMAYLDRQIDCAKQSIQTQKLYKGTIIVRQRDLSIVLQGRYQHTGEIGDLNEAIDFAQRAIDCSLAQNDDYYGSCLRTLSGALAARFERYFDMNDLDQSIATTRKALQWPVKHDYDRLAQWQGLASVLGSRYERTGQTADLEEAIKAAQQAVEMTPLESQLRVTALNTLSQILKHVLPRMDRLDSFECILWLANECAKASSGEHAQKTSHLVELAREALSECRQSRTEDNLKRLIETTKGIVNSILEAHRIQSAFMLAILAEVHTTQWQRLRGVEDLDESIDLLERSISAFHDAHISTVSRLMNLARLLITRHICFGRHSDLEEYIKVTQHAQSTMESQRFLGSGVAALADGSFADLERGRAFSLRYSKTKDPLDLVEAIRSLEQATAAMSPGHSELPDALMLTSISLGELFNETMDIRELYRAIEIGREGIAAAGSDSWNRAKGLLSFAGLLRTRFQELHSPRDFNEGIECLELGERLLPQESPLRAIILSELGTMLCQSPENEHQEKAAEVCMQAYQMMDIIPVTRLDLAIQTVNLLERQGKISLASQVASEAVKLMALLVNRTLVRNDQLNLISRHSTLPIDACSLVLKVGRSAWDAVQLLEMGRGIVLGHLIGDRSDISELAVAHPDHARRYDQLRTELGTLVKSSTRKQDQLLTREELVAVRQMESCIEDIRHLPGMDRFLLGPTEHQIQNYLKHTPGAIVVIIVSRYGSDAIIISASGVESLPLPGLTAVEVAGYRFALDDPHSFQSREKHGKRNRQYRDLLLWLWTECVKPILDRLGYMPKLLVEELPRIWWIGTGAAAFLPFHAAGDHNPGSIENTLSRAVSSYAPTIKALLFAREREVSAMRDSDPEALKLLIVTMPTTPGEKNLPGVTLEKAHIQNAAEGNFWVQSLTQPSVAKVLQTMQKADVVHFACHGVSDWIDPSKSHLLLQKDSKLDPLLIQDLLESKEARARIVYLSACSTAVDNSEVTDEAMHFASCFQAVGIPHVIGSLWPQSDAVSVEIAQSFYNHLGEREGTQASVSLALHRAILQVRKGKHRQPAAWAGYIHLGC